MGGKILDDSAADPARAAGNNGDVRIRGHNASRFSSNSDQ